MDPVAFYQYALGPTHYNAKFLSVQNHDVASQNTVTMQQ